MIDLAAVLRAAGVPVIEYPGWRTRGRPGSFAPRGLVMHHDASPMGPSPTLANYIAVIGRPPDTPAPLSQLWVCKGCNVHAVGTWHVLAAGRAHHAGTGDGWGRVRAGNGNADAYGVEVDHTTGERVDPVLYASLVRGSAALLTALGASAVDALPGHKEYAPGRKVDPDWDMRVMRSDVLKAQASPQKGSLASKPVEPPVALVLEDTDMKLIRKTEDGAVALVSTGRFLHLNGEQAYVMERVLGAKPIDVNAREYDVARQVVSGDAIETLLEETAAQA